MKVSRKGNRFSKTPMTIFIVCILITICWIPACRPEGRSELSVYKSTSIDAKDEYLWQITIKPYLNDPLWNSRNIYDAGHYLMVPLHAAFLMGEAEWQQQFADHFTRFTAASPQELDEGRLNRLHYFYLASRYIVLATQMKRTELIPPELPAIVYQEVKRVWQEEPAWQWARDPFPGGVRERVIWKLRTDNVERSYYRAIIDEELFLFAIAADLATYQQFNAGGPSPLLSDILEVADTVFQQEVVWQNNGGWLFQPGVWANHPDYAYAGRTKKIPGMAPSPVPDIACDSSHFHRFPLWLTSLACAYDCGEPQRSFYENLKRGLEIQLFDKVLVLPTVDFPSYRMTNSMDGRNGIYRWEYQTQGVLVRVTVLMNSQELYCLVGGPSWGLHIFRPCIKI